MLLKETKFPSLALSIAQKGCFVLAATHLKAVGAWRKRERVVRLIGNRIMVAIAFHSKKLWRAFFMHKNCFRSYLIYEKNTKFELPVGLVFSVRQLADWLGVSEREASRISSGKAEHREFGVFVDELTPEERGQYTATTAPQEHRTEV